MRVVVHNGPSCQYTYSAPCMLLDKAASSADNRREAVAESSDGSDHHLNQVNGEDTSSSSFEQIVALGT